MRACVYSEFVLEASTNFHIFENAWWNILFQKIANLNVSVNDSVANSGPTSLLTAVNSSTPLTAEQYARRSVQNNASGAVFNDI